ncbi:MAG TPA: class I SAM-dependent methyltransferase [Kofleriaceae bacterium]|nr:class I SAM-dependent methyltransferase [Kofleriaceae bacterium]
MKSLVLPVGAASFVAGGGRDVALGALSPAAVVGLAAGDHVRISDDRGADVGIGIVDPDNDKVRVFATAAEGFPAIDGALLGWRVERALALRARLGLVGPDRAYRLIHGAGDGLPGLACDVLGKTCVVYAYAEALRPLGAKLAEAVIGFARLEGAVVKLRARGGAEAVPQDVIGARPADAVLVTESGVSYEVHPLAGLNHGLFTDMREHRLGLARFAAGARVLNLFSYTGSLGLVCARAGAASVVSVDTSAGVQAWARGNFARGALRPDDARWRFETGDASRFLARAAKDKERYDLILIDPPSTSPASGGGGWVLARDYPALIAKAAAVIPQDGLLWLAANTADLASLAKLAHKGLREAGRAGVILEQGGLPPEYPTLAAQPADRYLQVCVLRLP